EGSAERATSARLCCLRCTFCCAASIHVRSSDNAGVCATTGIASRIPNTPDRNHPIRPAPSMLPTLLGQPGKRWGRPPRGEGQAGQRASLGARWGVGGCSPRTPAVLRDGARGAAMDREGRFWAGRSAPHPASVPRTMQPTELLASVHERALHHAPPRGPKEAARERLRNGCARFFAKVPELPVYLRKDDPMVAQAASLRDEGAEVLTLGLAFQRVEGRDPEIQALLDALEAHLVVLCLLA